MPETPATPQPEPVTEATAPESEAPTESAAPAGAPTQPEDIWQKLAELDPDELLRRHPRLAGKVGEIADRLYRRRLMEEERRRQEEEKRRLREEDPFRYVELEKQQEEEQQRLAQLVAEIDTNVLGRLFAEAPEPVQRKLSGKSYLHLPPYEARVAYLKDLLDAWREHEMTERLTQERQRLSRELREALRKELLGELNGREPAPDTTGGAPAGGFITQEEWDRHRHDPAWRRANRERINASIARGYIRA
jgi:hypothetical protein